MTPGTAARSAGRAVVGAVSAGAFRPAREWHPDALCREVDPDLFFPDRGESPAPALRVCAACEVRVECAAEALAVGEEFGVWGGTTERQRRRYRREQRLRRVHDATGQATSPAVTSGEDDAA